MTNSQDRTFIPAIKFRVLTPYYDFFCNLLGFGRQYQEKVLSTFPKLGTAAKVLDAGCGSENLAILLKKKHATLHIHGVDADAAILSQARRKAIESKTTILFKRAFLQKLPFGDNQFDLVYSSLVFHHLSHVATVQAIKEIHRVLKRGGTFILADLGPPRGRFSSLFPLFALIFEEGGDNYRGKLPQLLLETFTSVALVGTYGHSTQINASKK